MTRIRHISAFAEADSPETGDFVPETQVETQVLSTETQVETQVQVPCRDSQTQVRPLRGRVPESDAAGVSTGRPICPRCMAALRKPLPTGGYGTYCVSCYRTYWRDWQRERVALRRKAG